MELKEWSCWNCGRKLMTTVLLPHTVLEIVVDIKGSFNKFN